MLSQTYSKSLNLNLSHAINSRPKIIYLRKVTAIHILVWYNCGGTVIFLLSPVLIMEGSISVPGGATNNIQLQCLATGSSYEWYIQRPGETTSEPISSCDECSEYQPSGTGSLNINGVRARNEGVYQCMYTESSQQMSGPPISVTVLGMILFHVMLLSLSYY